MHVVDITLFYGPEAGGARTYLLAKRRHLEGMLGFRHTLVVSRSKEVQESRRIVAIPSVPLPFAQGYRLPVCRAAPALRKLKPDLIEAGDASYWARVMTHLTDLYRQLSGGSTRQFVARPAILHAIK